MRKITYFLVFAVLFLSCKGREAKVKELEQSDYAFKIPEMNLNITTSKQINAQFYVIFSTEDSVSVSDSIDYIKFRTGEMGPVNIILDPKNKNDIYILNTEYLKKANQVNYKLHLLDESEYYSLFFEPQIRTQPRILKYPFIHLVMFSSSYTIIINKYKLTQEIIKGGDIHGGW